MMDLNDFVVRREDSKSTRRLYKLYCNNCSKDRGYHRVNRKSSLYCRECFGMIVHKGKIVSKETRSKMSTSSWIKNNPAGHPMLGKQHTVVTKTKISISTATQNKNYIAKHKYSGPKGIMLMKSGWEVKYAQHLDILGIAWQYEPLFLLSDGRAYLPDFQLSTGDIIEIKGYMREDAKIKWEMFCKEHPELKKSLVTKVEMKQLNLIK